MKASFENWRQITRHRLQFLNVFLCQKIDGYVLARKRMAFNRLRKYLRYIKDLKIKMILEMANV